MNAEHKRELTGRQILLARDRIAAHVKKTPLLRSDHLSALVQGNVYLKCENLQLLGAFKVRGMLSRALLLSDEEKRRGIVVVSSGNHAISASYCGSLLGIGVLVYVPETTPEFKLQKIREYGASLKTAGSNFDECAEIMRKDRIHERMVFIDSGDDAEVVAGYGSIALEIVDRLPNPDTIMVPIGGGGLVTGIGLAAKDHRPSIRVYGVQTEACPAMLRSLEDRVCYEQYPTEPSLCEALVGGISRLPYRHAAHSMDKVVLTKEASIHSALRALLAHDKLVCEPSGTVGVSYLLEHPEEFSGQNVVIVLSGGNIGLRLLAETAKSFVEDSL